MRASDEGETSTPLSVLAANRTAVILTIIDIIIIIDTISIITIIFLLSLLILLL